MTKQHSLNWRSLLNDKEAGLIGLAEHYTQNPTSVRIYDPEIFTLVALLVKMLDQCYVSALAADGGTVPPSELS